MGLSRKDCEKLNLDFDALYAQAKPIVVPPEIAKAKPRAAHERGVMNKTEAAFAAYLQGLLCADGGINSWAFEVDTLRLSPDMTYTPDFRVERQDGWTEYYDVKGAHVWEDSIIKAKAAAMIYPFHRFFLASFVKAHLDRRGNYRPGRWRLRRMGVAGS